MAQSDRDGIGRLSAGHAAGVLAVRKVRLVRAFLAMSRDWGELGEKGKCPA